MKRARQLSLKECYNLLQIKKGVSLEEVKRAYRQRAFELHPDLNPNTPDAGSRFQQLNEAYVTLSHILQAEEEAAFAKNRAYEAAAKAKEYAREQARAQAQEQAGARAHAEATQQARAKSQQAHKTSQESRQSAHEAYKQEKARAAAAKAAEDARAAEERRINAEKAQREAEARAAAAQAEAESTTENNKEDVLRDLLNDPFARRVFEDIYSEIHKQERDSTEAARTDSPAAEPPKARKIQMEWGNSKVNLDFTHGVAGLVKGWLRNQIDEEQSFKFPASSLSPGARLRLQIRRGLSGELTTVEITLPADFTIGKPVRLKGLGKRIGPWQGDMYLTFEPR